MMTVQSKEDAQKSWWDRWWDADYSWEGLAQKRLQGWALDADGELVRRGASSRDAKPATLQDLWRAEEGRLILGPDRRRWTAIHVPQHWKNGRPAKAGWGADKMEDVETAIKAALARLPDTAFTPPDESLKTNRRGPQLTAYARWWGLPLDGAVLRSLPASLIQLPLIKGTRMAFSEDLVISQKGLNTSLLRCLFEKNLIVRDLAAVEVRVSHALIIGALYMDECEVRRLSFVNPVIFGDTTAEGLRQNGQFLLTSGRCHSNLMFETFDLSTVDLSELKVAGNLTLETVHSDSLDLTDMQVQSALSASRVKVKRLKGDGMTVGGGARFDELEVLTQSSFMEAAFDKALRFEGSLKKADFEGLTVGARADFGASRFSGAVSFARAHFKNAVSFGNVSWTQACADLSGAFREARFDGFVDFRGAGGVVNFAAFDGANLKGEVRFDEDIFIEDRGFLQSLEAATDADERTSLECGLRALKLASEAIRDRVREQTYYRYELITRRRSPAVKSEERLFSAAYGALSDYGASSIRPLWWALGLWAGASVLYLLIALATQIEAVRGMTLYGGPPHPAVFDAMSLSGRAMFNPFGVWSARGEAHGTLPAGLLFDSGAGVRFASRLVSTLQSVLSGVLLFLAALALRRRFQIN